MKLTEVTSRGQLSSFANDGDVRIRAYAKADLQVCQEIFTEGMEQLVNLIARVIFAKYLRFLAALSVFVLTVLAALQWTVTIFLIYVFACFVMLAFLYIHVYMECWKFINSCLATDLKNIEKSYMSSGGSCMWVAEWNSKVVGMVGLIHNESHKPGVAELQRMSVSPICRRMGIARRLLDALLKHAKDQQFEKIVLTTTSAQTPAIRLYKRYGFKLVAVFPYPQTTLADLKYTCFELTL